MQQQLWPRIRLFVCLAMVCLVAVLFAALKYQPAPWSQPTTRAVTVDDEANLTISRLDYSEVREGRTQWTVRAATARYYDERKETVLSQVSAVFFLEDGSEVELEGDEGVLDNASKNIEVRGKVHLTYGDAYRLATDRLFYDNAKSLIHTPEPVVVEGRGLILKGVGMRLEVAGRTLEILSHIETRLPGLSLSTARSSELQSCPA